MAAQQGPRREHRDSVCLPQSHGALGKGQADPRANKKVTDNTAALKDFPDVVVGSDGTSYAAWQDSRSGNPDIYFSGLANGAMNWVTPNAKISDDPGTAAQTMPRIGVDSAGNLTVAWIDARTSPAHVRVARKPSGGSWSASVDISPSPANVQSPLAQHLVRAAASG